MFNPISLYYTDGYKVGHKKMLAPGTTKLYGTWIPRNLKHAPKGIKKIISFGQQLVVRWLNDQWKECFFEQPRECSEQFGKDMSLYLGMKYDAGHFEQLWDLGYLPIKIKTLPEGIETNPNIPHMTFINTVDGYAWLTLFLETIISALAWKPSTSATIAKQFNRNVIEWITKTDEKNLFLAPYLCHDFSSRGLDPFTMISSGLGHATSSRGSDSIVVIPAARYFYDESNNEVCINSVNASEHSVSTTCIFTMGEEKMINYYLDQFPEGILSIVSDTFDLWKLITEYLPANKDKIMSRNGKLVIRPDSGDPVDIICGSLGTKMRGNRTPSELGVIELLWDIFSGTINGQGYKVLDPHIGAIYGDSITLDRQIEIYKRLSEKGFAATNIVLGVGSYTYQYNTRDTLGFAAKGAWFECNGVGYEIFKDPITDDGSKKSKKGFLRVDYDENGEIVCYDQQTKEQEETGLLQTILLDGELVNQTTLTIIRERLNKI